jgi:hypothetical protein
MRKLCCSEESVQERNISAVRNICLGGWMPFLTVAVIKGHAEVH